jgi:hypothetical protein
MNNWLKAVFLLLALALSWKIIVAYDIEVGYESDKGFKASIFSTSAQEISVEK